MFAPSRPLRSVESRRRTPSDPRFARCGVVPRLAFVAAAAALAGCGGGGGSSGSFSTHANLLSVTFPDPSNVNSESTDSPPAAAPLLQQIVFTFDGSPDPNSVGSNTLQIRDPSGFPVPGRFVVDG